MVVFHDMGMPSFDFDGLNSLKDFDIRLTSKPLIPTAEMRAEEVVVPGRDSVLTFTDGTYQDITIKVSGRIRNLESSLGSRRDRIKKWLMFRQYEDKFLVFSHFHQFVFIVRYLKPYEWQYHPPTGEYYTDFEFVCRPYKLTYSSDTIELSNSGTATMSPWMTFYPTDKSLHNKDLFEAGSYEVLDGQTPSMMYANNLLKGPQNRNDQLEKIHSEDGEGIDNFIYSQSNLVAESNCLYSFYDKSTSLNINTPQWFFDTGIEVVNGHTIKTLNRDGLKKATATFTQPHFKLAGQNTYYVSGKFTNNVTKVTVKELTPSYQVVKTLLSSGSVGDSFSTADTLDTNLIRVEIEFPYSSTEQKVSELIISPKESAKYSPRWVSYSATHIGVDVLEAARVIDPAVFRSEDPILTKTNYLQARKPEIRFTSVSNLSQSNQWESFNTYQITKTHEYLYEFDGTSGAKQSVIEPLKNALGQPITIEQAMENDNKLHFLQLARVGSAPYQDIRALNNKLETVKMEMRFEVPPTNFAIYDNTDGINQHLEVTVNIKQAGAVLFSADVSGQGPPGTNLVLNLPSAYLNKDIVIDTETFRVFDKATLTSLTSYCTGDFPKCWKGTRMQYQIDSKFNKASIKIRKKLL